MVRSLQVIRPAAWRASWQIAIYCAAIAGCSNQPTSPPSASGTQAGPPQIASADDKRPPSTVDGPKSDATAGGTQPARPAPVGGDVPAPPRRTRPDGALTPDDTRPTGLPAPSVTTMPAPPATTSTRPPSSVSTPPATVSNSLVRREPFRFAGEKLANAGAGFVCSVAIDRPGGCYEAGDVVQLRLQSSEAARLYLMYHQADGKSLLMIPNRKQPSLEVGAHQIVKVPADDGGFRIRVAPPFGREALQVLAARRPIADLDGLVAAEGGAPELDAALFAKLEAALRKSPADWAEHRVEIETFEMGKLPAEPPGGRTGLIVGIGAAPRPEFGSPLKQVPAAARDLHRQLIATAGFDRNRMSLLADEAAVLNRLDAAVQDGLAAFSHPGDAVLIYLAARVIAPPAAAGAPSAEAEYLLLPFDASAGPTELQPELRYAELRKTSLSADRLRQWLSKLPQRRIVVFFDLTYVGSPSDAAACTRDFFQPQLTRLRLGERLDVSLITACVADESLDKLEAETPPLARALLAELSATRQKPLTLSEFAGALPRRFAAIRTASGGEPPADPAVQIAPAAAGFELTGK